LRFVLLLTSLLFSSAISAQQSSEPTTHPPICPATHVRFTARKPDTTPVADLKPTDVRVWFKDSPGRIIYLRSGTSTKTIWTDTDILFVVPPFFRLNQDAIDLLIQNILHADNFHFRSAVLAPDGTLSSFTPDPQQLHSALLHAISSEVHHQTFSQWPPYEQAAFMTLRKRPGRHVIVDLADPTNPHRNPEVNKFIGDPTLDYLANFDSSQIYKFLDPTPTGASIPMGDASTKHTDIGPGNHSAEQMQEVATANDIQGSIWWLTKQNSSANGGRYDETLDALFKDILQDAPGSYDAIIQTSTTCEPGQIYSVKVTSTLPSVLLLGPNSIQEIPLGVPTQ
jgi:hypothetical protein